MRLILVEARPVRRQRLATVAAAVPGTSLLASCGSLMEAYTRIESEVPDLVAISRRMAEAPEHAMLLALMQILGVEAIQLDDDSAEAQLTGHLAQFRSTSAGGAGPDSEARLARRGSPGLAGAKPRLRGPVARAPGSDPASDGSDRSPTPPQIRGQALPIILIGASTGGVEALHRLLPLLPADCPPVVVVQHIRGAFSSAFAERLDRLCAARVCEAEEGVPLVPGQILVAPGDQQHLQLFGRHPVQARLVSGPPTSGHRPSVDALFTSALPLASQVVATLLTGMGSDGARGLLALRRAGALTIAQDQESSTVYGMPRVAAELGAATRILPLSQIAPAILSGCAQIAQTAPSRSLVPR